MIQKNLMLTAALLSLAFFRGSPLEASGLIGSPAPYFTVQSGDDKELNLDMTKGKVIAVFYETEDAVENKKRLKDEFKQAVLRADGNCKRRFSQTSRYRLFGRSLALPGNVEKKNQGTL